MLGLGLIVVALAVNSELTSHSTDVAKSGAHAAAVAASNSIAAARQSQTTAYGVEVEQRAACKGSTQRIIQELVNIDWPLYLANISRSKAAIGAEADISSREAKRLLAGMENIAAVRLDVSAAKFLPPVLAAVVRRTDFHCPTVTAPQQQPTPPRPPGRKGKAHP
jgi:hypothetical protein